MMNEQYRIYYDFMRICQMHDVHPRIRGQDNGRRSLISALRTTGGACRMSRISEIQHEKLKERIV